MRVTLVKEGRVRESAAAIRIYPAGWTGEVDDDVAAALAKQDALATPARKARARRAPKKAADAADSGVDESGDGDDADDGAGGEDSDEGAEDDDPADALLGGV